MIVNIDTVAFKGIEAVIVNVQVHISNGTPNFMIVGLPDKIVAESKERVRSAIHSIGLSLPLKKITINLAPADLVKEGSHFDLPIALGILAAMGVFPRDAIEEYLFLGELALDGRILPITGALPAAIAANSVQKGIVCPEANGSEAAWAGDILVYAPSSILSLINHFKGSQVLTPPIAEKIMHLDTYLDLKDVKGQHVARRALEIAAAGGHNLLMVGPPGAGKSMLASRLPSILPEMTPMEMLECTMVASISGDIVERGITARRPYRAPHHSATMPAMVGGGMGRKINPGEITRAHNGVLFLDELAEFPRVVLDSLRQPLEEKTVHVARANSHVSFPANFQLVAAMNPCRCGYLTDVERACNKVPRCAIEYQTKISGPFLDRIDIHIELPAVSRKDLDMKSEGESSAIVRERVIEARKVQSERYQDLHFKTNSHVNGNLINELFKIDEPSRKFFNEASDKLKLSMRSYNRLLKVARTIADLEKSDIIYQGHLAEALNYRQLIINKS